MIMLKKVPLAYLLTALFIFCCSCSTAKTDDVDEPETQNVTSVRFDNYRVTIPERINAVEESNGDIVFFLRDTDTKIGGITIVPYENADKFNFDEIVVSEDNVLEDFVKLIIPDEKPENYFFSGDGQGNFSLSIGSENGSDSVLHNFFPRGNQFYDIFFNQNPVVTPTEQKIILDSFAIES